LDCTAEEYISFVAVYGAFTYQMLLYSCLLRCRCLTTGVHAKTSWFSGSSYSQFFFVFARMKPQKKRASFENISPEHLLPFNERDLLDNA
jgi:hypothetical protein